MTSAGAVERVERLLRDALSIELPSRDTDLLQAGLLDSLTLVQLLVEVEAEFGVEIPLDDFDPDEFRTAESIARFVAALSSDAPGTAAGG